MSKTDNPSGTETFDRVADLARQSDSIFPVGIDRVLVTACPICGRSVLLIHRIEHAEHPNPDPEQQEAGLQIVHEVRGGQRAEIHERGCCVYEDGTIVEYEPDAEEVEQQ